MIVSPEIGVLVTSAGAAPAAAVLKSLRAEGRYRLRLGAVDMAAHAVGFCLADWSARVPPSSHPEYVGSLLRIAIERGVQYVIPIIDEELAVWARHRDEFEQRGISVLVNPLECIEIANDKRRTAAHCARHEIPHPACYSPEQALDLPADAYPLFVKPVAGRGSIGAARVASRDALVLQLRDRSDLVVQSFVSGTEFTTDVLTDADGTIVALVPKERLEVKSGMATKSVTRRVPVVEGLVERVIATFGIRGAANVQVILRADGSACLIEVNPKFATSLPLTVAAGVNIPQLLIAIARGEHVARGRLPFSEDLLLLRCWDDYFVPAS